MDDSRSLSGSDKMYDKNEMHLEVVLGAGCYRWKGAARFPQCGNFETADACAMPEVIGPLWGDLYRRKGDENTNQSVNILKRLQIYGCNNRI